MKDLRAYLKKNDIRHIRSIPYHPQTQGKIERYHRTFKNVINLDNYYFSEKLKRDICDFVNYYNFHRYHESLDNLTPADVFYERSKAILDKRAFIKEQTLRMRKCENLKGKNKLILDYMECLS